MTPSERQALGFALASFAASVAFLAITSMAFDFGACFYPSRAHPFFTSGRLITGALIPFVILYVHGLDRVLARMKSDWPGAPHPGEHHLVHHGLRTRFEFSRLRQRL